MASAPLLLLLAAAVPGAEPAVQPAALVLHEAQDEIVQVAQQAAAAPGKAKRSKAPKQIVVALERTFAQHDGPALPPPAPREPGAARGPPQA
jgi:hypothetical protein